MKQIKDISVLKSCVAIIALAGLFLTTACGEKCCGFKDNTNYQDLNGDPKQIFSSDANGCINVGCGGHNFKELINT
jgi:hypothetical protein